MISDIHHIYTDRGWKTIYDLSVGDRVVSYNPDTNYNEYDQVSAIYTEYKSKLLLGFKRFGVYCLMTDRHPLMLMHNKTKVIERVAVGELFGLDNRRQRIIYSRPLDPYNITKNKDDICWSARVAATYLHERSFGPERNEVWSIIRDTTGIEAQWWLEAFFAWTKLCRSPIYMKTANYRNTEVRDMIEYMAPRAGVGYATARKIRMLPIISITNQVDLAMNRSSWFSKSQEGLLYNIATRNGNFVARSYQGNFIVACNYS